MIVPPLQEQAKSFKSQSCGLVNCLRDVASFIDRTTEPPNHRLIDACKLIARILELETSIL